MRLDRDRIVEEALSLLDEVGLDALSTHAVAKRLGVRQPALYWYFKSRRALLNAMNDRMLSDGHRHRMPTEKQDWLDFLRINARSFRSSLLSHRDGARIHAGTETNLDDLASSERQLGLLTSAGWTAHAALDLLVAISRYTVGCVLEEQADIEKGRQGALDAAAAPFQLLSQALSHYRDQGHDATFNTGLDLLLRGASARLANDLSQPSSRP